MSAYEELWRTGVYPRTNARVVVTRISADMLHEHVNVLTFPPQQLGIHPPEVASVAVSAHGTEHPELSQAFGNFHRADVAGMPYLVARLEIVQVLVVPVRVCIADYADSFHVLLRF